MGALTEQVEVRYELSPAWYERNSPRYDGNSIYQAMIAKVGKRFSKGFTVLGSYTWSRTIAIYMRSAMQGHANGCGYENLFNLRTERSLDNQDVGTI